MSAEESAIPYKKSACILCSVNCGLDIQTGGKDGRELIKIKGDRDHVSSQGYLCNKAARLNHYQMGADRLKMPLRRKADGTYEPVDWDTAIREVADGLARVRDTHGGDKIYFIGGGGQGNHLGGLYSNALMKALGIKYQTNALAQEKTGEFWVQGKMFGAGPHGDFHHTEVAVFIGKNPWQSHGFPQTRKVMRDIANDPARAMVVLDPCLTESARMADFHLRVKPGTDAWCLSAMVATAIQEGVYDEAFVAAHTDGFEEIRAHFASLSISDYAEICGVEEELIRAATRRIASAESAAFYEDLGIQQTVHSTLSSYLQRILWVITGNFAKRGTHNIPLSLLNITEANKGEALSKKEGRRKTKRSPVLGSRIITGLLPCNEVPDEILTDHPDRFRAAIIQSSNPVHSYADSPRMREAMRALEFSVVIDIAMTETAREADYVLPASSQFEKHECTFFPIEFPRNGFQLRHPIVEPLPGTLTEAEINTRIIEALGAIDPGDVATLAGALDQGRPSFALAFLTLIGEKPEAMGLAPALLYRTLGPTLEGGRAGPAAPLWALCHQFAQTKTAYARNAGFTGSDWEIGEALFEALLNSPSGFIYTDSLTYEDSWERLGYPDKKIRLHLEELFPKVAALDAKPLERSADFPFVLAAGQRRATTTNTIIRDGSWDKTGQLGTLTMSPGDAARLALSGGDRVRVRTQTGAAETVVELSDAQPDGAIALPNGVGLEYDRGDGDIIRAGIAPNELTASAHKDFFAGTPWHKFVPAQVEKL